MVSDQPYYWQFLVSERYGGSEAVRKAINELIKIHAQGLADDLALQPAFTHINAYPDGHKPIWNRPCAQRSPIWSHTY